MTGNLRAKLQELSIPVHSCMKTEHAFIQAVIAIRDLNRAWKEDYDALLANGLTEMQGIEINDELSKHTKFFDVMECLGED